MVRKKLERKQVGRQSGNHHRVFRVTENIFSQRLGRNQLQVQFARNSFLRFCILRPKIRQEKSNSCLRWTVKCRWELINCRLNTLVRRSALWDVTEPGYLFYVLFVQWFCLDLSVSAKAVHFALLIYLRCQSSTYHCLWNEKLCLVEHS